MPAARRMELVTALLADLERAQAGDLAATARLEAMAALIKAR